MQLNFNVGMRSTIYYILESEMNDCSSKNPIFPLKGNCSGKNIIFFIPSIGRVCGSDAQKKKSDFLHGSVRRYKTLRSSTNCGCGHLMPHFVGIAITNSS